MYSAIQTKTLDFCHWVVSFMFIFGVSADYPLFLADSVYRCNGMDTKAFFGPALRPEWILCGVWILCVGYPEQMDKDTL